MSETFDPYHRWLGISPKHQPADYYRLLGLERFEEDPEVIRDAADRQMRHVRTYELGPRSGASQTILNELAAARSCLLDPDAKAAYDSQLRVAEAPLPLLIEPPALAPPLPPPVAVAASGYKAGRWSTKMLGPAVLLLLAATGMTLGLTGGLKWSRTSRERRRPEPVPSAAPRTVATAATAASEPPRAIIPALPPAPIATHTMAAATAAASEPSVAEIPASPPAPTTPLATRIRGVFAMRTVAGRPFSETYLAQIEPQIRDPRGKLVPPGAVGSERLLARCQVILTSHDGTVRQRMIEGQDSFDPVGIWRGTRRLAVEIQFFCRDPRGGATATPVAQTERHELPTIEEGEFYQVTFTLTPEGWERVRTLANTSGDAAANAFQLKPVRDREIAIDLGGGMELEMVLIPAAEFLMGSPSSDKSASGDEKPQHRVRITQPFYLGKYEVTQEQWEAIMDYNPSACKGPRNPVAGVTWTECQKFVDNLNRRLSGQPGTFQLPTEAQWEYASRAGLTIESFPGKSDGQLADCAWHAHNSGRMTHRVGLLKPNAWGLHDMFGNVWEWCQDWYDGNYYAYAPLDDPAGPSEGVGRVVRGGGCNDEAPYFRSARRDLSLPTRRNQTVGCRLARVLVEPPTTTRSENKEPVELKNGNVAPNSTGPASGPVTLKEALAAVRVTSTSFASRRSPEIIINGNPMRHGHEPWPRGLFVVALVDGKVVLHQLYDCLGIAAKADEFAGAINRLPKNAIVIIAVGDDATSNFNPNAQKAILSIGGRIGLLGQPIRTTYYCIGQKGLANGKAIEAIGRTDLHYPPKRDR